MGVVKIVIEVLLVALLAGVAFNTFFATNSSTWDAQTVLTWGIIPIVGIIGIVLNLLKSSGVSVKM